MPKDDPLDVFEDFKTAYAWGYKEFNRQALVAASTPYWCNNYYIQPNAGAAVTLVLGGLQVFTLPGNVGMHTGVNIVSAVVLEKYLVENLIVQLCEVAGISGDDLAKARMRLGKPPQ